MEEEKYYTIEEVAGMMKVVYMTVYRWIRSGKLEAFRVGKKYMIKKSSIEGLVNKSKVNPNK